MKKILRGFFFAAGAGLLLNGVHVTLVSNLNFGTLLVFALGALCLLFAAFYERLWKWLRVAFPCGCAVLLALCAGLSVYGSVDNVYFNEKSGVEDALVVLGCGVRGDRVSVGLARRLDKALD